MNPRHSRGFSLDKKAESKAPRFALRSLLFIGAPVHQVYPDMPDPKDDGRHDHDRVPRIDPQKQARGDRKGRPRYGKARKGRIKIAHRFRASEIADPIAFI